MALFLQFLHHTLCAFGPFAEASGPPLAMRVVGLFLQFVDRSSRTQPAYRDALLLTKKHGLDVLLESFSAHETGYLRWETGPGNAHRFEMAPSFVKAHMDSLPGALKRLDRIRSVAELNSRIDELIRILAPTFLTRNSQWL